MGHRGMFTSLDEWTNVAHIHLGLDIRVVSKRETWFAEMRDQNEFVVENDRASRRCLVYLKHVAAKLRARDDIPARVVEKILYDNPKAFYSM